MPIRREPIIRESISANIEELLRSVKKGEKKLLKIFSNDTNSNKKSK